MEDILGLDEFKVVGKYPEGENVLFVVEPVHYSPACPACGSLVVNKHGKTERHARDLNYFEKHCELKIIGDRYKCADCGKTFSQAYKSIDENAKVTNRLKDKIKKETLRKPFKHLADEYSLSVQSVKRFFLEYVGELEQMRIIKAPEVIGVDEAHLNKQMRAVITDVKGRKILELLPTRSKDTVLAFLCSIPDNVMIRVGTIDMYRPYKEALSELGCNITVVIDKFHVVRYAVNAMEAVRKQLGTVVPKEMRKSLVNTRYSLLKNREDATDADLARMETLFAKYPEYGTAYRLKESFRDIYKNKSKATALNAFSRWEASIPAEMTQFKDVAKTVNNWEQEIFSYFDQPYTNAYTESINNLIKEIEKRGRGYTFDVLRAKVLFGTAATCYPKYIRPKTGNNDMRVSLLTQAQHVLASGFGVDIGELGRIMENEEF